MSPWCSRICDPRVLGGLFPVLVRLLLLFQKCLSVISGERQSSAFLIFFSLDISRESCGIALIVESEVLNDFIEFT